VGNNNLFKVTNVNSKKFAKIGLSTTKGCGFNLDFCYAPQIFKNAQGRTGKAPHVHDHAQRTWVFKLN
jgi:hypothetical protein